MTLAQRKPADPARLRCLWIARYIPYPPDEGLKMYSARLSEALARAGCFVRVLGFGGLGSTPAPGYAIEWRSVPAARRGAAASLLSGLPLAAAADSVAAYRSLLEEQLRETWDVIVFDSYASGWALERCRAWRLATASSSVLVHVSHNHEEALWHKLAQLSNASLPRRLALWQNYRKVRALERRLVRDTDLVTTITEEDSRALLSRRTAARTLTLTPGYDGPIAHQRTITAATPRRAVIVGSFRWVVKRENLARFVAAADGLFAQHGIELAIAGDVPADLAESLRERSRSTCVLGYVTDLEPILAQSRIAVVPELIGGGFKLKFLDYIFARVPVATLADAATGLPSQLLGTLIRRSDFAALATAIVASIDRLDQLNRLQETAFEAARPLFQWQSRGLEFVHALRQLRSERAGGPGHESHPEAHPQKLFQLRS